MGRGVEPPSHQNESNEAGPEHSVLDPRAQALGAFIDETQAPDNEERSQEATDSSSRSLPKLSLWLVLKKWYSIHFAELWCSASDGVNNKMCHDPIQIVFSALVNYSIKNYKTNKVLTELGALWLIHLILVDLLLYRSECISSGFSPILTDIISDFTTIYQWTQNLIQIPFQVWLW